MIAAHANAIASLRGHFTRVAKYENAQRRIHPQIGLTHGGTQCVAELFELAESLNGGRAAIVADRLKRTELSSNPIGSTIGGEQFAVRERHQERKKPRSYPTHTAHTTHTTYTQTTY